MQVLPAAQIILTSLHDPDLVKLHPIYVLVDCLDEASAKRRVTSQMEVLDGRHHLFSRFCWHGWHLIL